MSSRLQGRIVLVTGAARGIGFATAAQFADAGCRLILTDCQQAALQEAAKRLRPRAFSLEARTVDVARRDQVDAMAREVLDRYGGLDILVNNAGIAHCAELADTSLETWQRLLDVNLWGPLYHVYAFLPSMKQRREGHIVNVSSGQAFFRLPTWGAYAVTKLALGAFSEILHFELRTHGIQVTTVYPYMVNTGFYEGVSAESFTARMSMRLLPYYSDTPEKVGRAIFNAVLRRKPVEMVSVVNDIGYYSRLIPPVSNAVSRVTTWLLTKDSVDGPRAH
ncbi:MAG: SDR family NAD(P)-dependent oxidoreductase [Myxococcales bacterium]|jgi:NAD(P)-dependent dehydrogenase (short-subunit alcohol dehydrogenase family)